MGWLDGYVAVVTGGAQGIGKAVVEALLAEGARVCVMDLLEIDSQDLDPAFREWVVWTKGDVTVWEDNVLAVRTAVEAFGRVDVFIGNAAIGDGNTPLVQLPASVLGTAFDEIFSVNVKGYILGARAALPELIKTKGSMIFTGSYSSFHPSGGGVLYVASKHAVAGLVRELAYELAPAVRVNGVAPGVAATEMAGLRSLGQARRPSAIPGVEDAIPLGFIPEPRDHAWPYVLLSSRERARAITGTFISTDSGFEIRGLVRAAGAALIDEFAEEDRDS